MASPKVMLGTPAYDGRVDVGYTFALLQSIQLCAQHGIALRPVWWPGEALVQHARNMLVKIAVESGVEAMVFVDADQEWKPEHVLAILRHNAHVVGAAVPKKSAVESYNIRSNTPNIPIEHKTGLWLVEGVGTGFLKLSKQALKDLWESSEPYDHNGTACRMVFDVGIYEGKLMGEDFILCEKLKELGYPILVDPSFTVSHRGSKLWTGDVRLYIEKLKSEMARAEPKTAAS